MNYKLHYEKLISKARNRSILKSEYKEVHHIIPKSLGGDNSKDNLVELFPEEHLVAHLLLVKIYPHNNKLIYAANMMTNIYTKRNNNKDYAWIKNKFNLINKEKTPELRKMYSDRMREFNKTYIATDKTNAKISKTVKKGWENNLKRKKDHSERFKGKNNPNFDNNLYEFEHKDGRKIICYQSILMKEFGCERAYALIQGNRKTNRGWKFTGRKFKRIEL